MYQICFLIFVVHKICRTLEISILHFVVGISRFCFLYYPWIYKYVFILLLSAAIQSSLCENVNVCDNLLNKPRISVLHWPNYFTLWWPGYQITSPGIAADYHLGEAIDIKVKLPVLEIWKYAVLCIYVYIYIYKVYLYYTYISLYIHI